MHLNDLDYEIPKELIALHPVKPRDNSKLVVVGKNNRIIKFNEIVNQLKDGDTLVFNNTKVINANLEGKIKERKISVNLNKLIDKKETVWSAFLKSNKTPIIDEEIKFPFDLRAKIIDSFQVNNTNFFHIKFNCKFKKARFFVNVSIKSISAFATVP